jgi:uncharacterized protein (TIGR02217 family)
MSFIEQRMLDPLSYGFSGGPTWKTRKIELRSGITRRNVMRSRPLHRFSGAFDKREESIMRILLETFNATRGAAYGFRFRNPLDYQADGEVVGSADGTSQTLQIKRTHVFGTESVDIPIRKPNSDVKIYEDGTLITATLDITTGMVTFTGTPGSTITWSGTFDIPVFFSDDEFEATIEDWNSVSVEIQLEEDLSA